MLQVHNGRLGPAVFDADQTELFQLGQRSALAPPVDAPVFQGHGRQHNGVALEDEAPLHQVQRQLQRAGMLGLMQLHQRIRAHQSG